MDKDKSDAKENLLERYVSNCEKIVIIHALSETKGNQSAAARFLGTTKRILTYKVNKYRIDCEQFRLRRNEKEN